MLQGDAAAMQQQVDGVAGTPAEPGMLAMRSVTSASAGRVREARNLTKRAIELGKGHGLNEGAGAYSAGDALWEGGVRQLPRGETFCGSDPRVVSGPEPPELERAGPCDLRRFDHGPESR